MTIIKNGGEGRREGRLILEIKKSVSKFYTKSHNLKYWNFKINDGSPVCFIIIFLIIRDMFYQVIPFLVS